MLIPLKKTMNIILLTAIMFSPLLMVKARADGPSLNLPSESIYIQVSNGTISFFDTTLMNVPAGYDVSNATYHGWCVDQRTNMSRSPETHEVRVFSSINPPEDLTSQRWDMVNYILNHKQGGKWDIQQAIWYFIDLVGNYTPITDTAWAIVNDTLANGSGYVPFVDDTIAVICYPLIYSHQAAVQVTIIEVRVSALPEYPSALILTAIMIPAIAAIAHIKIKKQCQANS